MSLTLFLKNTTSSTFRLKSNTIIQTKFYKPFLRSFRYSFSNQSFFLVRGKDNYLVTNCTLRIWSTSSFYTKSLVGSYLWNTRIFNSILLRSFFFDKYKFSSLLILLQFKDTLNTANPIEFKKKSILFQSFLYL